MSLYISNCTLLLQINALNKYFTIDLFLSTYTIQACRKWGSSQRNGESANWWVLFYDDQRNLASSPSVFKPFY